MRAPAEDARSMTPRIASDETAKHGSRRPNERVSSGRGHEAIAGRVVFRPGESTPYLDVVARNVRPERAAGSLP
jgi:hypothetical protein